MAQKCLFDNDEHFRSVAVQEIDWRVRSGRNSKESRQPIFGCETEPLLIQLPGQDLEITPAFQSENDQIVVRSLVVAKKQILAFPPSASSDRKNASTGPDRRMVVNLERDIQIFQCIEDSLPVLTFFYLFSERTLGVLCFHSLSATQDRDSWPEPP